MKPTLLPPTLLVLLLLAACDSGPTPPKIISGCYDDVSPATLAPQSIDPTVPLAEGSYVPGRLLVRFAADRAAVMAEYGLVRLESTPSGAELVRIPVGTDLEELLQRLDADSRVEYAEPNYLLQPLALPNDPLLDEQWHLLDFGLPQAWELETGDSDVVIAIIDSGVDTGHEDLRAKLLPGYDFYEPGDTDPNPDPGSVHGTHVAGIAAALGDNGMGVAGVAYRGVKILPVKVFDNFGQTADTMTTANAIRWAAGLEAAGVPRNPNPARILNLSLGTSEVSRELERALRDACEAGAIIFAAAGNAGREDQIFTPASAPGVIAVGSVDADRRRSYFSNYAVNGESVDLMAPGGFGPSYCGSILGTFNNDAYGCQAGTSMAAPFAAGVAALLWSQHPEWDAQQVIARLFETTLYDEDFMNPAEYGAGIVCADRALGAPTLCGA